MKVLIFVPNFHCGGAQRTIINLFNNINDEKITIKLVVGDGTGEARKWVNTTEGIIDLEKKRLRYLFFSLRKTILREKPDIVFSTMVDSNLICIFACLSIINRPKIIIRETNPHRNRKEFNFIKRFLIKFFYKYADKIISLSSGVKDEISEDYNLSSKKIITIHNPVEIDKIKSEASIQTKTPWGNWSKNHYVVISIGRLIFQKGYDVLIESMTKISLPVKLIIIGEGEERDNLEKKISEYNSKDNIMLAGFQYDIANWLTKADLFVLSSRWEGFGHVIIEAMASGIPVLSTNCPHGPKDIIVNNHNGRLVDFNADKIALEISELLSSKSRHKYVENAFKDIVKFSSKNISKQYCNLFHQINNSKI